MSNGSLARRSRATHQVEVHLLPHQATFANSPARRVALVAGRGSGKTWAGAYRLVLRAATVPGSYGVVAPTYTMLADIDWPMVRTVAELMRLHVEQWQGQMRMRIAGRSEIRFRSADRPDRLRGLSLHGLWIDEASLIDHDTMQVLVPTLREGPHPWIAATMTPKGRSHWTYDWFGGEQPTADTEIVRATTNDNPLLADTVRQQLYRDLVGIWSRQELDAEFVDADGAEWPAELWGDWVLVPLSAMPIQRMTRRGITVDPSLGKHSDRGDYSAIIAGGCVDGLFWVEADLARRPPHVLVADTLQTADRWKPHGIGMEAVAFQSLLVGELTRQRRVPWPIFAIQPDGQKALRIRRLGPAIVRRELRIADTPGGRLLYRQLRDWPECDHDDGPDALEMLQRLLTEMR